jgi:hypothetical protein
MSATRELAKGGAAILAGAFAGVALAAAARHVRSGSRSAGQDEEDLTEVEFKPRNAVLYLSLHMNVENIEEDIDLVEDEPWRAEGLIPLLGRKGLRRTITGKVKLSPGAEVDGGKASAAERRASRALIDELPEVNYLSSEGHDHLGDEILRISISSLGELKAIRARLIELAISGPDSLVVALPGHPYFEFRDFTLYPNGVNDERYDLLKVVILPSEDGSLRLMVSEDEEWSR